MWGNKEGWLISAVIVGVMGYMMWDLTKVADIAPPSGQFKNLREPIALPVKPQDALPGVMTEDRDAGDLYWKAIEAYRADPTPYDKFDVTKINPKKNLPGVELVLKGTTANRATLFLKKPETLVNYRYPWPELDAIAKVGQAVNSAGHYFVVSKKGADEALAKRYLHAGFSLGAKLYDERLTHGEMMAGIKLMQGAADSLRELAKRKGDKAREAELQTFSDQTSGYYTSRVQKLYEKVVSAGQVDIGTHAGDVFELARHNDDRMWKVEALLKVGRYKFNANRRGDQVGARRMLGDDPAKHGYQDWTQSPDPAVKAAATLAKKLTVEEYRQIQ